MSENYWTRKTIERRRFIRGSLAGGVGLGGLALVGCGDDDDAPAATPAGGSSPAAATSPASPAAGASASPAASPTAAVRRGGTLTINGVGGLDAPHLDVHQSTTQLLSSYGAGMSYSRLVRFKIPPETGSGWNSEWAPDLAASAEQPDNTTVIFKIRPNAKFHNIAPVNGRAAVGQDVKYSLERQIAMKTLASSLPSYVSLEVVDPATVRFKLKDPNADFLAGLAQPFNKVVAKEAVDSGKGGDLKEGPTIGTGPWILEEWRDKQHTKFKKNPDYFVSGLPYADNFVWLRIPDTSTAFAALKTGQILRMSTGITTDHVEQVKDDKSMVVDSLRQFGDQYIHFRMDSPPFNDVRVRRAIFRAISWDQIDKFGVGGNGYYTNGISLPGLDWELPEDDLKQRYRQDLTEAKSLLEAAGQSKLTFEAGMLALPPADSVGALLKQQFKAVGIELNLVPLDNVGYGANYQSPNNKYVMNIGTRSSSPLPTADLQPWFYTGASRNSSRLADPKFDALIDKQSQTLNPTERKAVLLDVQKYLLDNHFHWAFGARRLSIQKNTLQGAKAISMSEYDCWTRVWTTG